MEVYKIVTLKDPVTGEKLLPRIPQGLQYEVVGDEITPPIDLTLDASTLQGHPASDFVLKGESGTSYVKGETADPPESLNAGSFYETSDGYLYIGNSENQPVEVLTLAHELNIGTINGKTITQILDEMVDKKIGIDLGASGDSGSSLVEGRLFVGETVKFDGMYWLVAHIDYIKKYAYLCSSEIVTETQFGFNNTYAGSVLANLAQQFELSMSAAALSRMVNVEVNGVTAKVFVPSYEQMNGGFSWFSNTQNRICNYGGSPHNYWTSSPITSGALIGNAWFVSDSGGFGGNYGTTHDGGGFRPTICLTL